MKIMVVRASKGLGRAFVERLCSASDEVTGVSLLSRVDINTELTP